MTATAPLGGENSKDYRRLEEYAQAAMRDMIRYRKALYEIETIDTSTGAMKLRARKALRTYKP